MHVLHGTWLSKLNVFAFWGEDSEGANASPTPVRAVAKVRKLRTHPFGLKLDFILNDLDEIFSSYEPDGIKAKVWLPSTIAQPEPSPEAISIGMSPLEGPLTLSAWQIDMITLTPSEALHLLVNLSDPESHPQNYLIGSDLAYWQQAGTLLLNLIIGGNITPLLERDDAVVVTRWRPDPTTEQRAAFTAQMPTLCRAVVVADDQPIAAQRLLNDFWGGVLEYFVREIGFKQKLQHQVPIAFTSVDSKVRRLKPIDLNKIYADWQKWIITPVAAPAGGFRVCFRLNEPLPDDDTGDRWSLAYMLQAVDDPTLLVDAVNVWKATGRTLNYLNRRFDQPHENFLLALGQAAQWFAPVDRSLLMPKPLGVDLTQAEAFEFLTTAAPKLEQAGYGVLVPNWWRRVGSIKAKAKIKQPANENNGLLGRDSLLNYSWEVSVGEQALSRDEFEHLVSLKTPFVRMRGQWMALDPTQLQAALAFLNKRPDGTATLAQALQLTATQETVAGIEIQPVEAEGKLNELLTRLRDPEQATIPPLPTGLQATLRPYQQRGFGWLAQMRGLGLGGILADQMGLGKTVQNITVWLHERERMGVDRPALLVAPTSVVGNWKHELGKFAPTLRVYVHQGTERLQGAAFIEAALGHDAVLTSYALLHRDLAALQQVKWSSITLDEAQNIKNSTTKMAQAARSIPADHRLAMTGTPVENRLSELWSIMQFTNPGYLGSEKQFRERFAVPIERLKDQQAATTLKRLTAPFILRRLKTDPKIIDDLPEKQENKVYCSLTQEQATLYAAVVKDEMEAIDSTTDPMARRGGVLRMLTALKQICNHPSQFLKETRGADAPDHTDLRSGKLMRLQEMLEEALEEEDRALIFTQYAETARFLERYLKQYLKTDTLLLTGSTPPEQRTELVRRFQAPNGPRVFILSLKAGGTGLNLTAANHVFHFDRWYNPAVEDQATDRAFRIGQHRNVQVHKFICLGTLEEKIDELIERKRVLADSIIGDGEGWLTEMSTDDLRELVTLRAGNFATV